MLGILDENIFNDNQSINKINKMESNNNQEKHYKISINNDKKLDSEKLNLESQSIIEKNKDFI